MLETALAGVVCGVVDVEERELEDEAGAGWALLRWSWASATARCLSPTMTTDHPSAASSPSSSSQPASPEPTAAARTSKGKAKAADTADTDENTRDADPEGDGDDGGDNSNNSDDAEGDDGEDDSSTTAPAAAASSSAATTAATAAAGDWQAIFSPSHNAYYFYNSVTQETTWTNPLQTNAEAGPSNSTSPSDDAADAPAASSSSLDIYTAAAAQGIDPALAHLDPSLAASGSAPGAFTYTAKFNARTGAFARPDGRDPTHLSEYERAKRMSEFYFDVNAWEQEVEKRKLEEAQEEEAGRKRKKPTKKDLVSTVHERCTHELQVSRCADC